MSGFPTSEGIMSNLPGQTPDMVGRVIMTTITKEGLKGV